MPSIVIAYGLPIIILSLAILCIYLINIQRWIAAVILAIGVTLVFPLVGIAIVLYGVFRWYKYKTSQ